jgi:protein dithiol oxidoreductase (disulfide-forming)
MQTKTFRSTEAQLGSQLIAALPASNTFKARRTAIGQGIAIAGASLIGNSAFAQMTPKQGTEYKVLGKPVPTDDAKKIELIEFFWFACPHCNVLEPLLKDYVKRLPADVSFKKVHVNFQEPKHQQLFYALEALGKSELNDKVFYGIHVDKKRLDTADSMADYLAASGVKKDDFLKAFNSFSVDNARKKATSLMQSYKVDGVPAFGINGKFYTAPSMAGGNEGALKVVQYLLDLERKSK